MAEVQSLIAEYLRSGKTHMMQLATCMDDRPWCCTVYYAVDDELNIIWLSTPARRHSQEVAHNAHIAGVIAYDQQPPRDTVRGVQFEGIAEQLVGEEEEAAVRLYMEQLKRTDDLLGDMRSGKNKHRAYRIRVSSYVLFDSENFPTDPRQEWQPRSAVAG